MKRVYCVTYRDTFGEHILYVTQKEKKVVSLFESYPFFFEDQLQLEIIQKLTKKLLKELTDEGEYDIGGIPSFRLHVKDIL